MLPQLALGLLLASGGAVGNVTHSGKSVEFGDRVTYHGTYKDGVEAFLGIKYGQDTSGKNRFKAPRAYTPTPGSSIDATSPGLACPQDSSVGESFLPLYLTVFREYSEDCLSLNVNRPNGTTKGDKLPVMVFIHGMSIRAWCLLMTANAST